MRGKHVVMVDDIIATGGTVVDAARIARENGALSVGICATHGIFADGAVERLNASPIDWIAVTNTVPRRVESPKIRYLSVAELLAEAVKRIHEDRSVSELFE